MQPRRKQFFQAIFFGLTWIVVVAFGLRILLNYDSTAGTVGAVPQTWPSASGIHRSTDRLTLVMLAHPRCPCTRATMSELARIMALAQGKLNAYVLFNKPKDSSAKWDDTDLRHSAAVIPGVTVVTDLDGVEIHHFGGETSGTTLLFDRDGRLLFSGGITEARGHAGDNRGKSAILAAVNNQKIAQAKTLVFGCPIADRLKPIKGALCLR